MFFVGRHGNKLKNNKFKKKAQAYEKTGVFLMQQQERVHRNNEGGNKHQSYKKSQGANGHTIEKNKGNQTENQQGICHGKRSFSMFSHPSSPRGLTFVFHL